MIGIRRDHAMPQPSRAGRDEGDLQALVTGRDDSLFERDFAAMRRQITDALAGRRVLVVGGGGSIGAATTALLTSFRLAALHIVDHSENYLAELIRDLRSRCDGLLDTDLRTFPIDYGGPLIERLLADASPYDVVLNFAALKHVRSEKDLYSLLQMMDTNVIRHRYFKERLASHHHGRIYFAVSTDKAANPTSLMGASKRLMEDVVFGVARDHATSTTAARFANVAYSNGSLLQSFIHRLERRQPLAVPRDTRRYFISHREAAELCVLAAFAVPDRHVAFPKLNPDLKLLPLHEIAERLLQWFGFAAEFLDDACRARREVEALAARGRWPVLLTPLDTSGEKPYEEFVGEQEEEADLEHHALSALHHRPCGAIESGLLDRLGRAIADPSAVVSKADIVEDIKRVLPNFHHVETGRNLDQRL